MILIFHQNKLLRIFHADSFNENKKDFDIQYFNECFIEFIDSGSESEIGDDFGDGRKYYEITIPIYIFLYNCNCFMVHNSQ